VRLYGVLAAHTWALWAAIQAGTGSVEADLTTWGAEQYAVARGGLTSPELPELLAAAVTGS
jgi:hypothetical protein